MPDRMYALRKWLLGPHFQYSSLWTCAKGFSKCGCSRCWWWCTEPMRYKSKLGKPRP